MIINILLLLRLRHIVTPLLFRLLIRCHIRFISCLRLMLLLLICLVELFCYTLCYDYFARLLRYATPSYDAADYAFRDAFYVFCCYMLRHAIAAGCYAIDALPPFSP